MNHVMNHSIRLCSRWNKQRKKKKFCLVWFKISVHVYNFISLVISAWLWFCTTHISLFLWWDRKRIEKRKQQQQQWQRQHMTADKHLINKSHANISANYDLFHFTLCVCDCVLNFEKKGKTVREMKKKKWKRNVRK